MQGLTMDYQLNVADDPAARRGAVRPQVDHEPAARQVAGTPTPTPTSPGARSSSRSRSATSSGSSTATASRRSPGTTTSTSRPTSGAPVGGFVTHTLNLRLHPDDLTYIATHAGDRVLIADKTLWPLVEAFRTGSGSST